MEFTNEGNNNGESTSPLSTKGECEKIERNEKDTHPLNSACQIGTEPRK